MLGYRGKALKLLVKAHVNLGDKLRVEKEGKIFEGMLMPRTERGSADHIVLKLANGYNLGIMVTKGVKINKVGEGRVPKLGLSLAGVRHDPSKPNVTIVGTGGTIASRVDYRTGAVYPAFTPQEIYAIVPEIAELANIRVVEACNVFSEHMTPHLWIKIARVVAKEINSGANGVIVAHGTDTMSYTAVALNFILKGLFRPVVLVGSQRSSDRPSSDAVMNLVSAAVVAARSDIAEVCVVMHGSMEDDFCLIHRGTKVRKCHTSRRDAFQTINDIPFGMVKDGTLKLFHENYNRASSSGKVKVDDKLEPRVALVKVFPGMQGEVIKALVKAKYKGVVLEGTGLGHVPETLFDSLKYAIERGMYVVMTSQCLWGRTNMNVYSTGRDLLQLGVIPGEDMLPEVAYIKLMWVLGHTKKPEEVSDLMQKNLAGEISSRTRPDTFIRPDFTSISK